MFNRFIYRHACTFICCSRPKRPWEHEVQTGRARKCEQMISTPPGAWWWGAVHSKTLYNLKAGILRWHDTMYPLVTFYIVTEHGYSKWGFPVNMWFSIVMLVYQRVTFRRTLWTFHDLSGWFFISAALVLNILVNCFSACSSFELISVLVLRVDTWMITLVSMFDPSLNTNCVSITVSSFWTISLQ